MASQAPTLTKKEFKNWIKGSLALLFTKEGLTDFVSNEIIGHHKRLLQLVPAANIKNKCTCTINSLPQCTRSKKHNHIIVPGPTQLCSRGVCHILMDGICKDHRYRGPSWKNTHVQNWSNDAFEVAKCYMAPDGYSDKSSLSETDFNGILSVIINNLSFTTLIQDNLATEPNICTEARKVGREIRHTPDHLLSDHDLQTYIDDLIKLLCDPLNLNKNPSAQAAVMKLTKLKTNDLTIHEKDITDALRENIRDVYSDEHRHMLQKINDHYSHLQTDSVAEIDRITAVRKTELEELAIKLRDDFTKHAELKMHEIEQSEKTKEKSDYEKMLKEFQEELIACYRKNESMIPAAPLDYGNKVPIEDLYVLPPMRVYGKPNIFELGKITQKHNPLPGNATQETHTSTISQLFISDDIRYKNIYITANAGFGKTSLSQKLTMTWCQAHSPKPPLTEKYEDEELESMKYFDFLFLLHLRVCETLCNLDDLIMQMLSNNLSRNTLYTKEFLQGLLHEKKCVILIDGLDEWAHPEECIKTPAVPHNNHPDNCTVVTTSRPWKMGTIGLSENDIDRHIEISELDYHTRLSLEANAIRILNKRRLNLARKFRSHFDQEVKSAQIGDIICIPYILLQLMCLFFGGCPIGKSKCEIYSNITEFTLKLGLKKPNLPQIPVQSKDKSLVPNCMKKNKKCCRYFNLIMKLGKLAFCGLFSEQKESSLIFDRTFAREILTNREIEFCLKVGLLCQTRDNNILGIEKYKLFFQHKSIQEFFSALYIRSEWQNDTESVKSTVRRLTSSLSSTLEMENLFVFVCGMSPEVYSCIFGDIQVKVDLVARRYTCRADMYSGNDDREIIDTYLSMQMPCMQESIRNENKSCPIYLNVVLDRFLSVNSDVNSDSDINSDVD